MTGRQKLSYISFFTAIVLFASSPFAVPDSVYNGILKTAYGTRTSGKSEKVQSVVWVPDTPKTAANTEKKEVKQKTSSPSPATIQKDKNDGGAIVTSTFKSGTSKNYFSVGHGNFRNCTQVASATLQKIASEKITYTRSESPEVLIIHTHTSECYEANDDGRYDKGFNARTLDTGKNMVRVGDEIANELNAAGINTVHDTTIFDRQYNGSYSRSEEAIRNWLKKYPSIEIVLDVHRDALENSDGERIKPTAEINGKNAAQVMIISGVDDGTMDFPNWRENLKFASLMQDKMEGSYPGLTRPVLVDYRRYNMFLTDKSLLIEVGGHANTLDEAVYSGSLIGKSLAQAIISLS